MEVTASSAPLRTTCPGGERIRRILAAVWKLNFLGREATREEISAEAGCMCSDLDALLERQVDSGLLEVRKGTYTLTSEGRERLNVVLAGGVFDILHPGHVFFLERAKAYGDVLVVVVARDSTVTRRKRIPVVPEEQRVEMVAALKPVDIALLGERKDIFATVEKVGPDTIVLGPDQSLSEEHISSELRKRGIGCRVVRVKEYRKCRLPSTRSILQRIIELNFPDRRV